MSDGETAEAGHSPNHDLDQSVNGVMFLLAYTGDSRQLGRYLPDERDSLIKALEALTEKLRADAARSIVSTTRSDPERSRRRGIVGGGALP